MKKEKREDKIYGFVERYKVLIGGILLVLICAGGAVLLYRANWWVPKEEARSKNLEEKITGLEEQLQIATNNSVASASDSGSVASAPQTEIIQNSAISTGSKSVAKTATAPKTTTASAPTTVSKTTAVAVPVSQFPININTASATELDLLPGIGPVYAQRIVDYRTQNGNFKTIEEIKKIKGIGDVTFGKLKDDITVN